MGIGDGTDNGAAGMTTSTGGAIYVRRTGGI